MDEIQVVMVKPVREAFEEWLNVRGLKLFHIATLGDDLPTYGVTFSGR